MQVKDEDIFGLIDEMGSHFQSNLNNRYLRQAIMAMIVDRQSWSLVEQFTEKSSYYRLQGYHFDELYDRILAMARFVHFARREIQPQLRSFLSRLGSTAGGALSGNDRVLREMSLNNFSSNLNILADMVDRLFQKTVAVDMKMHPTGTPVYKRTRELSELGRYLVPR